MTHKLPYSAYTILIHKVLILQLKSIHSNGKSVMKKEIKSMHTAQVLCHKQAAP